jgi:cytochrome bd ubiquinol oxidase subunit II
LIFTPMVLVYQTWTYYVFRKRIGSESVETPVASLAAHRPRPAGD